MANFDIIEDVMQKFNGTVIMYDKKAVLVKAISFDPEKPGQMDQFCLQTVSPNARSIKNINLNDPALDYKNFQIGYANGGAYASWWYRRPHKQWSQGLSHKQMGWRVAIQGGQAHDGFSYQKPFINMLEGIYPSIETIKKTLIDHEVVSRAFHRDFALSYDDIHDDFVLEYHGSRIGSSLDRELKQFRIVPEARHLIEALQEARNVQS